MSYLNQINTMHLNYLTPLSKWRVMDLESLRKEAHGPNYNSFARIIRKLEKAQILQGYRHPFSKKKYVFYSTSMQKQIQEEGNAKTISKENLIHDIKVTEISKSFLAAGWIEKVILEHQLLGIKSFKSQYKVIPDAMYTFEKDKFFYDLAFELELTQKCKSRIKEKAKQYMVSSKYDYVVFFFPRKQMMNTYMKTIEEEVGAKNMNKFLFVTDEKLVMEEVNLETLECIYQGRQIKLRELFEGLGVV